MQCDDKIIVLCLSKVRNLPYYDGLTDVDKFLDAFECEVPEDHCL